VLAAHIADQPECVCTVVNRRDGTHAVSFVPTRAGKLHMHIQAGDVPLSGSPFLVDVVAGMSR